MTPLAAIVAYLWWVRLAMGSILAPHEPGLQTLQEWLPMIATIGSNQTHYYQFPVNTVDTGASNEYETLVFLSGNVCAGPEKASPDVINGLQVYYSFNATDIADLSARSVPFEFGYMLAIAQTLLGAAHTLYLAVTAPISNGTWLYQVALSQNDLVHQWDDRVYANVIDTDFESALIITGNISTFTPNTTLLQEDDNGSFNLFFYDKMELAALNNSWCAVRAGGVVTTLEAPVTFTTRDGMVKQQFDVQGLNQSREYVAYLTQDFAGTSEYGGVVFRSFQVQTQSARTCKVIYDLEFCDNVAYAVPLSAQYDVDANLTALKTLYDSYPMALFENFTHALDQVACDTESDAAYSTVRTCADCSALYKKWLCAVTIPRCSATDEGEGSALREEGESRNPFVNEVVHPKEKYYEILPSLEMCHHIVQDCPVNDFAFACPQGARARESYWVEDILGAS